jgi:phosphoadenylyl-sulfate reductase (thioredoxin)
VAGDDVDALVVGLRDLEARGLRPREFRRGTMACTGIEFCKLAIVETKGTATRLVAELEERLPTFDRPLSIHVNGCPNSCARIQVADIGLKGMLVPDSDGTQVEGFQVHLGGDLGPDAALGRKPRGLKVMRTLLPMITIEQQAAEHGADLFSRDPDRCCAIRKVEPLERGLAGHDAWVSGLRRDDAPTRAEVPVIGWDTKRRKVKVNPIAGWTDEDVARYSAENGVLENPLRQIGYASIGCAPCTRPVAPGEDARAGRWAGRAKTECGLHQ